jgi:ADP-heptose:LPS heptosyltransferase
MWIHRYVRGDCAERSALFYSLQNAGIPLVRQSQKRIVVFLQNRDFFGAQICHVPLLEHLRAQYPDGRIYVVSKHKISFLFKELGLADEVITESGKWGLFLRYLGIGADVTLNLRRHSGLINAFIAFFNTGTKIGFTTPVSRWFFTRTERQDTGIYRARNYLRLLNADMNKDVALPENGEILIMPGAGGAYKVWNLGHYLDVACQLALKYPSARVSFVLGKKEGNMLEAIRKRGFPVHYDLDIRSLFSVVKQSKCVIANDCGPSHIAQIYGKPSIILYSDETCKADTTIKEWFNDHEKAIALVGRAGESIDTIAVEQVLKSAERFLGESPAVSTRQ